MVKALSVRFRAALIANEGDRRLIERTVEIAKQKQGYNSRALKAALDSSPLWGAARVEDTYNLLGHALRKALEIIACHQEKDLATVANEAGTPIMARSSLKAALDLDWDDPEARVEALTTILQTLNQVESWVEQISNIDEKTTISIKKSLEDAKVIKAQDVEFTENGHPKLCNGVSKDRRIAIEDQEMRHGRKSRSQRFDGYKRHILKDLESGLICAVGVTPANVPG